MKLTDTLKRMHSGDESVLLKILESNKALGLYIWIDLINIGLKSENIDLWLSDKEHSSLMIFRYGTSLHIWTNRESCTLDDLETEHIIHLVAELRISSIHAHPECLNKLLPSLSVCSRVEGYVYVSNEVLLKPQFSPEPATAEDAYKIAQLIETDKGLSEHYDRGDLEKLIYGNIVTGSGRSKIIRKDGIILAHAATYAECDELAVISGVVTRPGHTGRGYGSSVVASLSQELLEEGKTPYMYVFDKKLEPFYEKIGFNPCERIAKVVLQRR